MADSWFEQIFTEFAKYSIQTQLLLLLILAIFLYNFRRSSFKYAVDALVQNFKEIHKKSSVSLMKLVGVLVGTIGFFRGLVVVSLPIIFSKGSEDTTYNLGIAIAILLISFFMLLVCKIFEPKNTLSILDTEDLNSQVAILREKGYTVEKKGKDDINSIEKEKES